MELLMISLAVLAGVDLRRVGLLGALLHFPLAVIPLTALAIMRGQSSSGITVDYCDGVASELRAGSSLRQALAASASAVGRPALAAQIWNADLSSAAVVVGSEFPGVGRELNVAIASTSRTGGPMAAVFDGLASLAIAEDEMEREVRVATAPAKAAATLLLTAPTLYLAARWESLHELFGQPGQRTAGTIGAVLVVAGLVIGVIIVRRAK
jgi:Flp pilus assembly protein TadB